jgi:hypothetical protein
MAVDCDVLIAGSGVEKPLEPYNIDHSTHPSCSVRLVFRARPSPDGKLIAVGSGDRTVTVLSRSDRFAFESTTLRLQTIRNAISGRRLTSPTRPYSLAHDGGSTKATRISPHSSGVPLADTLCHRKRNI